MMEKCDFWYRIVDAGMGDKIAPSESTGFEVWKKINPRRRQFA
jgi:hypothetical protein